MTSTERRRARRLAKRQKARSYAHAQALCLAGYENVHHDGVRISVTLNGETPRRPTPEERTKRFLADWPVTLALLDD